MLNLSFLTPSCLDSPLVGRSSELELMLDALNRVEEERSLQVITLMGAPGQGKTRLIYEFLRHASVVGAEPTRRAVVSTAKGRPDRLALFARCLRSRFGLTDAMSAAAARQAIREEVTSVYGDRKVGDVLYFLGQIIDLPFEDSPLTRAVGPDASEVQHLRRSVVRSFLAADADQKPLVMVFEDLHEAHRDSLSLLAYLMQQLTGPVLLICSARSELDVRYEGFRGLAPERHLVLELGPLRFAEAEAVAESLLVGCEDLPRELVTKAVDVAQGNPALLERMVKTYHQMGVLKQKAGSDDGEWDADTSLLDSVELPQSLDDVVESRVAALNPTERRILQRAACIGSVFWLGSLLALERMDLPAPDVWQGERGSTGTRLEQILTGLVERGYVLAMPDCTFPADREYVFKHNKERERLQRLIGPQEARRYHQMIADWLEHKAQVHLHEDSMGTLARHRELSGSKSRAGISYLKAADIARQRFSNQTAAEFYRKGLALLAKSDAGRRIDGLHNYGDVLLHLGRSQDALAQFREMQTLAFRLDMTAKAGAAHNRIGRLYRDTGRLPEAEQHLLAGLELFRLADDRRGVASSLDDIGKIRWMGGHYSDALSATRDALAMRRRIGDRRGIALSLNNVGLVLKDTGRFKDAREAFEQALNIRREIGDLLGVSTTLGNLGSVEDALRNFDAAKDLYQQAFDVAIEVGDRSRQALMLKGKGDAHRRAEEVDQAVVLLEQSLQIYTDLGDLLGQAEAYRSVSKAYLAVGRLREARKSVGDAVELFIGVESQVHVGLALRTLGDITAAGGWGMEHADKCRDYYLRATDIFSAIGNDLQLARTYRAYSKAVGTVASLNQHETVQREAAHMDQQADGIFQRLKREAAAPVASR